MAPHRELKREEVRAVFTAGMNILALQGALPEAVHSCIRERDWPKLARRLVTTAQDVVERPILIEWLKLSKSMAIEEAICSIERLVTAGKAPCVFLRGKSRHYTVISGYTPLSLKLFDSFGFHRLLIKSCGTTCEQKARHRLHVQSIIALAVE